MKIQRMLLVAMLVSLLVVGIAGPAFAPRVFLLPAPIDVKACTVDGDTGSYFGTVEIAGFEGSDGVVTVTFVADGRCVDGSTVLGAAVDSPGSSKVTVSETTCESLMLNFDSPAVEDMTLTISSIFADADSNREEAALCSIERLVDRGSAGAVAAQLSNLFSG